MQPRPEPALLEVQQVGGVTLARFARPHLVDQEFFQLTDRPLPIPSGGRACPGSY